MPFPSPRYFYLPYKYHNTKIRPKPGITKANVKNLFRKKLPLMRTERDLGTLS
jgi:hypothetical protein